MLYLDIGNRNLKLKSFKNGHWAEILRTGIDDAANMASEINDHAGETVIVSSVRNEINQILMENCRPGSIRFITIADFGTGRINYHTPGTLGVDRVLACEGARFLAGGEPVTVIDAGSACTVDIMDQNGVFHGGVIMPGLYMLESALKLHAPELPAVDRRVPHHWPAKTTEEAIQWGITGLFVQSVRWIVERYRDQFGDIQVWVTGGDAHVIKKYMGGAITLHPDLIFEGLRMNRETMRA